MTAPATQAEYIARMTPHVRMLWEMSQRGAPPKEIVAASRGFGMLAMTNAYLYEEYVTPPGRPRKDGNGPWASDGGDV